MDIRLRKVIIITFFSLIYLAANLPLIRLILIQNSVVILATIGHSPSQFLFLPLLFPAAILLTYRMIRNTVRLSARFPEIRDHTFWKLLVGKYIIIITSIIICLLFAFVDRQVTPPDIFQKIPSDARDAALLNKQIITLLAKAKDEKEKYDLKQKRSNDIQRLKDIYTSTNNIDRIMINLQFLVNSAVIFLVSMGMWMIYLNLRILGTYRLRRSRNINIELRNEARKVIPHAVLCIIIYLFWPPLRSYNLFEIYQILEEYSTFSPVNIYAITAIAAISLAWIYYSKFSEKLISTAVSLITFIASGALMGITSLTPETLVNYIGSGMSFGNLFFLVFILVLVYIFGSEIIRQISQDQV